MFIPRSREIWNAATLVYIRELHRRVVVRISRHTSAIYTQIALHDLERAHPRKPEYCRYSMSYDFSSYLSFLSISFSSIFFSFEGKNISRLFTDFTFVPKKKKKKEITLWQFNYLKYKSSSTLLSNKYPLRVCIWIDRYIKSQKKWHAIALLSRFYYSKREKIGKCINMIDV